jgi:uncharacterized protein
LTLSGSTPKDLCRAYGEGRPLTLGRVVSRVLAVAYTMRGEMVRLILARKANRREPRKYPEALPS